MVDEVPLFIHKNKRIITIEPPILQPGEDGLRTLEEWYLVRVPEEVYESWRRADNSYGRSLKEVQRNAREANKEIDRLRKAAGIDLLISYEIFD